MSLLQATRLQPGVGALRMRGVLSVGREELHFPACTGGRPGVVTSGHRGVCGACGGAGEGPWRGRVWGGLWGRVELGGGGLSVGRGAPRGLCGSGEGPWRGRAEGVLWVSGGPMEGPWRES